MCCRSRGFTTDAKRNENKQKKCCPVRTSSWMDIFFVANSLLQQKTTTTKHCQISENSDMELLDAAGKRPIQIRFIFNGQRHFTNIERSKTTNKRLKQLCLLFQVFLFSEPKQTECRTWKIPLYSAPFSYFHHVCCILFLSRIYLLCYVLLRVFVFYFLYFAALCLCTWLQSILHFRCFSCYIICKSECIKPTEVIKELFLMVVVPKCCRIHPAILHDCLMSYVAVLLLLYCWISLNAKKPSLLLRSMHTVHNMTVNAKPTKC